MWARAFAVIALSFGVVTAAAADDGGTVTKRKLLRKTPDAGVPTVEETPSPGGPTPGCPAECYSSCGGGAARDPDAPPTWREENCAGCRNICMDTGKWPPGAAHVPQPRDDSPTLEGPSDAKRRAPGR